MISPAFCTSTVSPMRMSFSVMKSWLWRVALVTVVPASRTGESTALGVSTPVRPTWTTMFSTVENFFSGGYLNATAHLGNLAVEPSRSRSARWSILMTAPSMSKG